MEAKRWSDAEGISVDPLWVRQKKGLGGVRRGVRRGGSVSSPACVSGTGGTFGDARPRFPCIQAQKMRPSSLTLSLMLSQSTHAGHQQEAQRMNQPGEPLHVHELHYGFGNRILYAKVGHRIHKPLVQLDSRKMGEKWKARLGSRWQVTSGCTPNTVLTSTATPSGTNTKTRIP